MKKLWKEKPWLFEYAALIAIILVSVLAVIYFTFAGTQRIYDGPNGWAGHITANSINNSTT